MWYTDDEETNMRVLISAPTKHPLAWRVTKIENIQPFGIQKLTIYSTFFNEKLDYVNLETGEMYADYYTSDIKPIDPTVPEPATTFTGLITTSTEFIKVGGSYKTIKLNIYDDRNNDVTKEFAKAQYEWHFVVDDKECTDDMILRDVTYDGFKIKLPNDTSYLGKILKIKIIIFRDDIGYLPTIPALKLQIKE